MLTRRHLLAAGAAFAAELAIAGRVLALEDAAGNKLNLPSPPRRIVAINPAMVETVVAIGALDRLVGIGGKVSYPEQVRGLPSVGGALGFSVEAVLALDPDLVVMAVGTDAAAQLTRPLSAMGVPIFLATYSDFASILNYMRRLGDALGLRDGADRLVARMQGTIAELASKLKDRPRLGVYMETGAAGTAAFQTVRAGHYADDGIRLAGGRNVFTLAGPRQVTVEGIADADPDVIVVLASDPSLKPEDVAGRPGWTALRAVREKKVAVLPRGFMLIPGPRQAEAISILARAIHPEAFVP
ncbi:ABC transporter substrate-binding protein [Hyphomicrobium sp.]|uniref:ABC transporter substrate-binding protein n=1 Tax=Hyphomicrobium sp. TaxID=82 RepID=UPI0025BF32C3|nr:ABC transporter substrate-binding protein [Hyphomicrobium sp.]MCC7250624.1 ABC transporter substrate-binding protein [Hyphomicrobium sp.]